MRNKKILTQGTRWFGEVGDDSEGGVVWALVRVDLTDAQIHDLFPRFYRGPGCYFTHRAWIQRTARRVLVRQLFGMDI